MNEENVRLDFNKKKVCELDIGDIVFDYRTDIGIFQVGRHGTVVTKGVTGFFTRKPYKDIEWHIIETDEGDKQVVIERERLLEDDYPLGLFSVLKQLDENKFKEEIINQYKEDNTPASTQEPVKPEIREIEDVVPGYESEEDEDEDEEEMAPEEKKKFEDNIEKINNESDDKEQEKVDKETEEVHEEAKNLEEDLKEENPFKLGDEIDVVITELDNGGLGIVENGKFTLFVRGADIGDKVHVKVSDVLEKTAFADIVEKEEVSKEEKVVKVKKAKPKKKPKTAKVKKTKKKRNAKKKKQLV